MLTDRGITPLPSACHSIHTAFVPPSFRASSVFPVGAFDPYSNSSRESVTGQRIVPHRFSSMCGRPESFLIVFLVSLRGRRARMRIGRVAEGSHCASLHRRAQGQCTSPPAPLRVPRARRATWHQATIACPATWIAGIRSPALPARLHLHPPPLALWERGRTAGPRRAAAASPCDMSRREG
jgi:hypothetical protein